MDPPEIQTPPPPGRFSVKICQSRVTAWIHVTGHCLGFDSLENGVFLGSWVYASTLGVDLPVGLWTGPAPKDLHVVTSLNAGVLLPCLGGYSAESRLFFPNTS